MQDDELHIDNLEDLGAGHGGRRRLLPLMRRLYHPWQGSRGAGRPRMPARVLAGGLTVALALTLVAMAGDSRSARASRVLVGADPIGVTASEAAPPVTLAGQPPAPVGTSDWQQVTLPNAPGTSVRSMVPSPTDPSTIFACTGVAADPPGADEPYGPITAWRTRDAGHHWTSLPLPTVHGMWCTLQVAADDPARATLLVGNGNGSLFLTDDGGDSWMRIALPTFDLQGGAFLWYDILPTAHHIFVAAEYDTTGTAQLPRMQVSSLMRTNDDGRTWMPIAQAIDGNRVFRLFPMGGEDTLVTDAVPWVMSKAPDSFHAAPAMWLSRDAGNTWTELGLARSPTSTNLITLPIEGSTGLAPIYAPVDDQIPSFLFRVTVAQVTDMSQTAEPLPPLPVPGARPDRVGVLQVARETHDGRLLAFGADPHRGVPSEAAMNHATGLPSQWLWIYDPRVGRWLVWPSALPVACTWGAGGYMDYGATWTAGAALSGNSPAGTYLWVRLDGFRDNGNVAYRLFVPDAPPGQLNASA